MPERLVINKGKTPVWPPILPATGFTEIVLTGLGKTVRYFDLPSDTDWDSVDVVEIYGRNLTKVCHATCFYEYPNAYLKLVPEGATHLNRENEFWYREGESSWQKSIGRGVWSNSNLTAAERSRLLIDIRLQQPGVIDAILVDFPPLQFGLHTSPPDGATHTLDNAFLRKTGETWLQWSAADGSWSETTHGYDWLDLHAKPLAVIGTALHDAKKDEPLAVLLAPAILQQGVTEMSARAAERDQPNGERTMVRCVAAFNVMFGHRLTEEQGWQFMELLKMARASGGGFKLDDYVDGAAYAALAGEAASRERNNGK